MAVVPPTSLFLSLSLSPYTYIYVQNKEGKDAQGEKRRIPKGVLRPIYISDTVLQ